LSEFSGAEKRFDGLFEGLPGWCQNELLGETVSCEEGDGTCACSLVGGAALMGF
jgi:hypothetical protein